MPETNGCWLGSEVVTRLLASTPRCVQHCGIYTGHPGVPLGPQLLLAACLEGEGHTLQTSMVPSGHGVIAAACAGEATLV